jgi:hypothetical protein
MNNLLSGLVDSNEQLISLILTSLAIIFIVSILRSVFRLLMPILVIGLVMVVFLGFAPSDVINKGRHFIIEGSNLLLENIIPFLDDNFSDNRTPSEHDPFKDRESIPNHEEKDTDIFGEQDDEDLVNKL